MKRIIWFSLGILLVISSIVIFYFSINTFIGIERETARLDIIKGSLFFIVSTIVFASGGGILKSLTGEPMTEEEKTKKLNDIFFLDT